MGQRNPQVSSLQLLEACSEEVCLESTNTALPLPQLCCHTSAPITSVRSEEVGTTQVNT